MKRFAKLILILLGGVVGLGVVLLIAVNLYLQSAEVQTRIRIATERALGTPVAVKRTLFTPWSGLILSGLSMPDPIIPGANLMEAPSFSLKFELSPLFRRKFVISEITLDSPDLFLRQNEEGRWVVRQEEPEIGEEPPPAPGTPDAGDSKTSAEKAAEVHNVPDFTVELRRFSVHDGEATFYDRRGRRIGHVSGLDIEGAIGTEQAIAGDLTIRELEVAGLLHPSRLRAHFVNHQQKLEVTDIKCELAGGRVRGEFFAVLPKKKSGKPEIALKAEISDVEIPKLIAESHGNETGTSGTLAGSFRLDGDPGDDKSLTGGGEFSLIDAQIRPVEFLRKVGTLFGIAELQMLDLQQATLKLEIRDARVWINDLTLRTENMILAGSGPIKFNGKMDIDGRLLINDRLQKQLAGVIAEQNFSPSENANFKQLAFSVKGRIDRPETDLLDRLTGFNIGKFGGMLRGLLQPPRRSGDDDGGN